MPRLHLYLQDRRGEQPTTTPPSTPCASAIGNKIAPVAVPIWDEDKKVTGIIDVLNKRAYEMQDCKRRGDRDPRRARPTWSPSSTTP